MEYQWIEYLSQFIGVLTPSHNSICLINVHWSITEASRHIKVLNTDISPSTSTLSYPGMYEEPLTTQALTIDFTPVEGEDDNQIVIKKCIDFWDFIENNPKLKKFCAMPDPVDQ